MNHATTPLMRTETAEKTAHAVPLKTLAGTLGLFLWATLWFAVLMVSRPDYWGHAYDHMEGMLTAGTANVARQWYDEGALHLRFRMYWEPRSVEYPTLDTRTAYVSFPPGAIIPVYGLSRITRRPPSVELVTIYNLFNAWAVGLCLGLLVWMLLRRAGLGSAAYIFAGVAPLLYFFLPAPFFEHEMGYFSDQAVILPFVLCILLAMIPRRACWPCDMALAVVLFWGLFTDWLFLPVAGCVGLLRIVRTNGPWTLKKAIRDSLWILIPVCAALLLFGLQLYGLGAFSQFHERFLERSGAVNEGIRISAGEPSSWSWRNLYAFPLHTRFWTTFIPQAYGFLGEPMIAGLFVLWIVLSILLGAIRYRRAIPAPWSDLCAVLFLSLIPPLIYCHFLQEHVSHPFHFFSTLKFAVPLSILPCALVPGLVLAGCLQTRMASRRVRMATVLFALIVGGLGWGYAISLGAERNALYAHLTTECETMGNFIARNTGYSDIVFSRKYELPHHFNGFSGKQTHLVRSAEDMEHITARVLEPYTINLFQERPDTYQDNPLWAALAARAYEVKEEGGLRLLKIRQPDFEAVVQSAVR